MKAILFLLWLSTTGATLVFTNPEAGQLVWTDSMVNVECSGGPAIHHLQEAYLYRYTPGFLWLIVDSLDVTGKEGLVDSFQFVRAGSYYIRTRNDYGRSCAGNVAHVPDTTTAGVPLEVNEADVLSAKFFNIRGQLVTNTPSRGIYFQRREFLSGKISIRPAFWDGVKWRYLNARKKK